jgi:hypothetical protein
MTALHVFSGVFGGLVIALVLLSAAETVVLPRQGFTRIAKFVFALVHRVMVRHPRRGRLVKGHPTLFGPVALLSLPLAWMMIIAFGFSFVFWAFNEGSLRDAFVTSGSSLTTLGFAEPHGTPLNFVAFVEATIGLGLVALLISYLPTIYGASTQRERGILTLRPFAGTPPTAGALLMQLHRTKVIDTSNMWPGIAGWFTDLEGSHVAFPALCYFPVRLADQSWVASAGSVLDASALLLSATGLTEEESVAGPLLTLSYGISALVGIARAVDLPIATSPLLMDVLAHIEEPPPAISIARSEYEAQVDALEARGVLHIADRDRGWREFTWMRSGYDTALRQLAGLTGSVPAPWTTDRPALVGRPRWWGRRLLSVTWPNDEPS